MNKKIKIAGAAVAAAVILTGSAVFFIDYTVRAASEKYIISKSDPLTEGVILVLGAQVKSGGRVSHILYDRLTTAYEIYKKYPAMKIIISGDHGTKHYDEVNTMKKFLLAKGADPKALFMDHAGFNTYDSVYRAKAVFKADKIVIVTQKYHLYRAIYIARGLGLNARGIPADRRTYVKIRYFKFREIAARCKDFISVNFIKPEPVFLGKPYPFTGDGRATHDLPDK